MFMKHLDLVSFLILTVMKFNWKKLAFEVIKAIVYAVAGFFGGNAL